MKIIFFGNSDFSVLPLKQMIDSFDVVGVVTAPDSVIGRGQQKSRSNPVKELALAHNIPVLQPAKLKNNEEFYNDLKKLEAYLYVIVSYGKILPKDMIDIPKYKTLNLHASLLPLLRGAAPIQYALWNGLSHTGNTVQFITEKMDEGDIILQQKIAIDPQDDYLSLESKLSLTGSVLLRNSIETLQQKDFRATPQDHSLATYTKLINKEDGAVVFSMTATDIVNTFRAFKQRPGIYIPLDMGNVKVLDCAVSDIEATHQNGEILSLTKEGVVVSCDESSILLKTLQAPNKKPMNAKDFANGNRLTVGTILK